MSAVRVLWMIGPKGPRERKHMLEMGLVQIDGARYGTLMSREFWLGILILCRWMLMGMYLSRDGTLSFRRVCVYWELSCVQMRVKMLDIGCWICFLPAWGRVGRIRSNLRLSYSSMLYGNVTECQAQDVVLRKSEKAGLELLGIVLCIIN